MIKVENVSKSFDGFKALDNLSMNVPKGSIYGLVGPNGAGKSTIIRHITGVYKQDSGSITIDGENIYENTSLKARFAYIPDDFYYFTQANTLDMMKFYKELYPNFSEELFFKIADCFSNIDLKRNIRSHSKGMQKQVAFMLSLSCRPDLLILDEPVDGLDPVMRRQIWSLIMSDVAEHEVTVLISSHNLRELEDVCDHVGIMNHGRLLIERSLDDLQNNITKLQLAFNEENPVIPEDINVMHKEQTGRVITLIVRDNPQAATQKISKLSPLILDVLPLTLEEIFIYELGGENYAVKDIIL